MATADILLLQKVEHLGYEGDEVTVRAGYARNYLLPRGFAIPVTRANRKQIEALRVRRAAREAKELGEAKELAERIRATEILFVVKTGEKGKMFGAITAADLVRKFGELGITIERKKVHLEPIKHIGPACAKIKLHHGIFIDFTFEIISEASGTRPSSPKKLDDSV
ncbi:MAG: 50S ribosomal protein L9 [Puniceicoccales bacterium]|jgi:large subunit ribosomal protein L9|nr:50S ribosomal protein L9 [Puniceicoccales bacterium]